METINLLPPKRKRLNQSIVRLRYLMVVLIAAAVLGLGGYGYLLVKLKQVNRQIAQSKTALTETNGQIDSFKDTQAIIAVINERLKNSKNISSNLLDWEKVLQEIAAITPPTVKLTTITSGEQATAQTQPAPAATQNQEGEASAPPPASQQTAFWQAQGTASDDRQVLIFQDQAERSPLFANVLVVSKTKQKVEGGSEQVNFSIKFALEKKP